MVFGSIVPYNRVRAGQSQEATEDGSLFNLSPLSPEFLMRLSGAAGQHPEAGVLLPSGSEDFDDSLMFLVTRLPMLNVNRFRGQLPLWHCLSIRCRLVAHICRVSLRFRLCWLRGCPLARRDGPLLRLRVRAWLGRGHAGLVLQRLHELSVLFSGRPVPSRVVCILLQPIRAATGTLWCEIWCNDVLRTYSYLLGACPGYVAFILDLLYGTILS